MLFSPASNQPILLVLRLRTPRDQKNPVFQRPTFALFAHQGLSIYHTIRIWGCDRSHPFFNIPINIQRRYHWFGVLFVILKPLQTDTGQESGFGFGHNTALVGWDLGAPWNAGSVHDGSKQKMGHRVYNAYFILEVKAMDSLDPSF